jgi:hypothetical protein
MSTPTNIRNFDSANERGQARPVFSVEPVLDQAASDREGRQIWKDEERVTIYMPGNNLNIPCFKVTDEFKERWPKEYAAFKAGIEPPEDGIPIEQWPILNKSMVRELRYLNIRTVEDLAGMSDATLQRVGIGGNRLRDLAKAYLDDSLKHALEVKLSKQNESQAIELAALKNQVEELSKIATAQNTKLMQLADAPNPLATMIPGNMIPQSVLDQPQATSSLDKLAKRKPGRPSKTDKDAAAGKAA